MTEAGLAAEGCAADRHRSDGAHFIPHAAILIVVCFLAFWWRLGSIGLIDPDEPFYAQSTREMVSSGDWLTPRIYGEPQFEKPILYYWLVASSFHLLGESEFAGRMPTALFATALVLLTWLFGRHLFGETAGLLAGIILATGIEFTVMSRLMLTDIPLAVFLTGAVCSYWMATTQPRLRNWWWLLHFVCAALAVLTKGPIGSIIPLLTVVTYHGWFRGARPAHSRGFWLGVGTYLLLVIPWYAVMFARFGRQFWDEFFVRDNWLRLIRAEHPANNHVWYYAGLLLIGSVPWMPVVALAMRRIGRDVRDPRVAFVASWLFSGLIFLTIAQSKLPSYGIFLFVPLALLAAMGASSVLRGEFRSRDERWLTIGFALLQAIAAGVAPFFKAAQAFRVPALIVGAILIIAAVLLMMGKWRSWLAVNATAAVALIVAALTAIPDEVDANSSARAVATRLKAVQMHGEPLLSGRFLVRGIYYYLQQPITVLANKPQPFWAAHPLPVLIWDREPLHRYLAAHPSALCVLRSSDFLAVKKALNANEWDTVAELGANRIVRIHSEAWQPER